MATAPAQWHADPAAPYVKADKPTDFERWEVVSDASKRGLALHSCLGQPALVTAKAKLRNPPGRWNNDPAATPTCTLEGKELIEFLKKLEDWLLPKIPGVGCEVRTCIRTNVFQEQFARAKVAKGVRYYDAQGHQLAKEPEFPPTGVEVWLLISLAPYCVGGAKGLSVRVLALQAA